MINLIGVKFGRWTVLLKSEKRNKHWYWLCRCTCGNIGIIRGDRLRSGDSTECISCASKIRILKYGVSGSDIYHVWEGMKQRCYYKKHIGYKYWGGRGISVCNKWLNDAKAFCDWAINHGYRKGLQIDRIDNDGNYESSNCRFVTNTINMRNSSNTKLTLDKAIKIRKLLQEGHSQLKIAEMYNVARKTIGDIKTHRTWKE